MLLKKGEQDARLGRQTVGKRAGEGTGSNRRDGEKDAAARDREVCSTQIPCRRALNGRPR